MSALVVNALPVTGAASRLLVLLHGYGADEHDLAPVAELIDPTRTFRTICPRGPVTVMPFGGAGWYERSVEGHIDPAAFLAAVDAVDATIDAACEQHDLPRRTAVVIGFSQGGAMAVAASLRSGGGERPAAMACLSGMLPEVEGLDYAFDELLPRILVQHGTMDPLVTVDRGRFLRQTLANHAVEHEYREYPMEHEINGQSVVDLGAWLATV
ncbi:MAG: alpha/beta fold hydrolase [Actinomycetota bacterium]